MKTKFIPTTSIIFAAVFWAATGLFNHCFNKMGFNPSQIACFRMFSAAIFMSLFMLIKDRRAFKIKLSDLPLLAVIGVVSIYITAFLYVSSMTASSISVAAILMYTAPFIVVISSVFIYKEKLTFQKILALIIAFAGCVLVSGTGTVNIIGVIFGLLSGVTYASYSILSKLALKKLSSSTVTLYGFIFAGISSLFAINPIETTKEVINHGYTALLLFIGIGIVTSLIPYTLYTFGLKYCEAGKASILCMTEPLVATVFGFAFLGQTPGFLAVIGIVLIVLAVIIIEIKVNFNDRSKRIPHSQQAK